jgi:hypothetical protein
MPPLAAEYGLKTTAAAVAGTLLSLLGIAIVVATSRAGTGVTIVGLVAGALLALLGLLLCWPQFVRFSSALRWIAKSAGIRSLPSVHAPWASPLKRRLHPLIRRA